MPTKIMPLDGTPTNLYEINYDGCPVISEVAKRDANGQKIDETYVKKSELDALVADVSIDIPEPEITDANLDDKVAALNYIKQIDSTELNSKATDLGFIKNISDEDINAALIRLGYARLPALNNPETGKQYVLLYSNGALRWVVLEANNSGGSEPEEPPVDEPVTQISGVVAVDDNNNVIRLAAITDDNETISRIVYTYDD